MESLTLKFQIVESENKELRRILNELKNELVDSKTEHNDSSLKETVNSIKEEIQQFENDNQQIKNDNQHIKHDLKCKETRLALGQVAYRLEAEIWIFVLPNEEMGYTGMFRSMKEWLNEHSSLPEGKEAQKRWDDLKRKLNWNERRHKHGLKLLKLLSTKDAFPENVNPEAARKELKEGRYIAGPYKKNCEEIIDMLLILEQLNSRT